MNGRQSNQTQMRSKKRIAALDEKVSKLGRDTSLRVPVNVRLFVDHINHSLTALDQAIELVRELYPEANHPQHIITVNTLRKEWNNILSTHRSIVDRKCEYDPDNDLNTDDTDTPY